MCLSQQGEVVWVSGRKEYNQIKQAKRPPLTLDPVKCEPLVFIVWLPMCILMYSYFRHSSWRYYQIIHVQSTETWGKITAALSVTYHTEQQRARFMPCRDNICHWLSLLNRKYSVVLVYFKIKGEWIVLITADQWLLDEDYLYFLRCYQLWGIVDWSGI